MPENGSRLLRVTISSRRKILPGDVEDDPKPEIRQPHTRQISLTLQEESHADKNEIIKTQIREGRGQNCCQRDAPQEAWHFEIGTAGQRGHSQEP